MRFRFLAVAAVVSCLVVESAFAQAPKPVAPSGPATGKIAGKVTEKGKDPVAFANVIILGTKQGAQTDDNGNYVIVGVPVGTVQIKVSQIGFESETRNVQINAGLTTTVNFDLGGGKTVKAIPVPGHTLGSYVFLYDGVLFSGDAMVFKQGRLDRAPKVFDADPDAAKASLTSLKQQLGATEIEEVCTGHGGCTPKGLGKNLFEDLLGRLG